MSVRSSSYQPSSTTSSAALAADSQEYRLGSPPQIDDSPAQLSSAPRPNTSSDISFGDEDAEENFSDRRSRGCCVNACPEFCTTLSKKRKLRIPYGCCCLSNRTAVTSTNSAPTRSCSTTFTLRTIFQILGIGVLMIGIIIGIVFFIRSSQFQVFLEWIRGIGEWGYLLFGLLFIVLSFPWTWGWTVIAITCGYLFGPFIAPAIVFIGDSLGYIVSYFIVGKCCKAWVQRKIRKKPKLKTVIEAIEKHPILFVLLLRSTPLVMGLQNGLLACSSIGFWYYLLPSMGSSIPTAIVWTLVGHFTAKSLAAIIRGEASVGYIEILSVCLQIAAVIIISVLAAYLGRRALRRMEKGGVENSESSEEDSASSSASL